MSEFTLSELTDKLRECAGDPAEGYDLDRDDVTDVLFFDLGYDSLALLQVTGVLKRERGVVLRDDEVMGVETPRELLQLINADLSVRAA
ncbi:Acyl carrier protein [Kitasatospora sp. MMS16-BH015]|uniref:acyl carrier protein n=1 Tax=Kitasatospora sp. MMS16-BH015 TaxID=2018025 RepID=UPI000CA18305|nr:acyl carrier protein [Kitasatospora sp. MMS16-BH015]AUG78897.1 Acyl carrier protein [Kitasatospora sp. MMS16-BH015]